MKRWAALMRLPLKAPARPRSEVKRIELNARSRAALSAAASSRSSSFPAAAAATLDRTLCSIAPYGRAAITRSCARRSFAAETIFMALVICCVFLTERIRRRMSIRLGIADYRPACPAPAAADEVNRCLNSVSMFLISALRASSMAFFSRIVLEDSGVRVLDEAVQLGFKPAHLLHRNVVQKAVGSGEDDQHLLFKRQRLILTLLEDFDQTAAAIELLLRGFVEIGAELRECGELAILREFETK